MIALNFKKRLRGISLVDKKQLYVYKKNMLT